MGQGRETRILKLFDAATELSDDERRAFLESQCKDDPELRAEVEQLLQRDPHADLHGSTLDSIDAESFARMVLTGEVARRFSSGDRLQEFVIEERLGAGGMGEVYRARDSRLHRPVALKVLSPRVADSSDLRKRFLREAQAVSRLTHPRICTLYDARHGDGGDFLVMELLNGVTLSEELQSGPLPIDRALTTAVEIAEALEHAHSEGIIHRDLKPGNVMRTGSGIKVLDFGLAKSLRGAPPAADTAEPGTVEATTAVGLVLGTPAYMSPQQARGEAVDGQADIWAFGCVLYELLSGKDTFGGETPTDVIAAVVAREPDWSRLPSDTPQSIRRLLRRCLEKDPRRRIRDIGDVRLELEDLLRGVPDAQDQPREAVGTLAAKRRRSTVLVATIAAVVSALVTVGAAFLLTGPKDMPSAGRPLDLSVHLPAGKSLELGQTLPYSIARRSIAISPDGGTIVYVAHRDGDRRLVSRRLEDSELVEIPGTEGAYHPFFSPDASSVAFFTDRALHRVSLLGGRPIYLCDTRHALGGSWGQDDSIVFADSLGHKLIRVDASGGTPRPLDLTPRMVHEEGLSWPRHLPDGRHVLVSSRFGTIRFVSLETGSWQVVNEVTGTSPDFLASGHILYVREGDLYAASFDPVTALVTGASVPVLPGVRTGGYGAAQYAIADTGTLIVVPGGPADFGRLVWRKRGLDGVEALEEVAWEEVQRYGEFRLSSDRQRVVATVYRPEAQLWVGEAGTHRWWQLAKRGERPLWSPGDEWIYFCREGAEFGIYRVRVKRGSPAELVLKCPARCIPYAMTSDGRDLLFGTYDEGGTFNLYILDIGTRKFEITKRSASRPNLSPDDRWLAYTFDEAAEVHIAPFPAAEPAVVASSGEGEEPVWSQRGDELFYRHRNQWFAVDVTTDPELKVGEPELIIEAPYVQVPGFSYDYDGGSDRFLMIKSAEQDASEIRVLTHWRPDVAGRLEAGAR